MDDKNFDKINDLLDEIINGETTKSYKEKKSKKVTNEEATSKKSETIELNPGFEYSLKKSKLGKVTGVGEKFIVPPETIIISSNAFKDAKFNEIFIPKSVMYIGDKAFNDMEDLLKVTFEEKSNLKVIGDNAFSKCANLATINLPDSIFYIGEFAFYSCHNLKKIHVPFNLYTISKGTFYSCKSLKEITYDENCMLKHIEELAFAYTKIKKFVFPKNVKTIGQSAFYNIISDEIIINEGVKRLPVNTFNGAQIDRIVFPDSLEDVNVYTLTTRKLNVIDYTNNIKISIWNCIISGESIKSFYLAPNINVVSLFFFSSFYVNEIVIYVDPKHDGIKIPGIFSLRGECFKVTFLFFDEEQRKKFVDMDSNIKLFNYEFIIKKFPRSEALNQPEKNTLSYKDCPNKCYVERVSEELKKM